MNSTRSAKRLKNGGHAAGSASLKKRADTQVGSTPSATHPNSLRQVLWSALVLIAITVAVYAPVRHFDFVPIDDPSFVSENTHVAGGLTWSAVVWAFSTGHTGNWHPLTWLSHMLDVEVFGMSAPGSPSRKPRSPFGQHASAVLGPRLHDARPGPERLRRRALRHPSASRGVGGLGGGTKGRPQHAVLPAHPLGVRRIRATAGCRPLPAHADLLRTRADGQADARHTPASAPAARRLAAAARDDRIRRSEPAGLRVATELVLRSRPTCTREDSAVCAQCRVVCRHVSRSAAGGRCQHA